MTFIDGLRRTCVPNVYPPRTPGPQGDAPINAVEVAEVVAFEWVDLFNTVRPEYLGDLTPVEAEKLHYDHFTALPPAG